MIYNADNLHKDDPKFLCRPSNPNTARRSAPHAFLLLPHPFAALSLSTLPTQQPDNQNTPDGLVITARSDRLAVLHTTSTTITHKKATTPTTYNQQPTHITATKRQRSTAENATDITTPLWPSRVLVFAPVATSHNLTHNTPTSPGVVTRVSLSLLSLCNASSREQLETHNNCTCDRARRVWRDAGAKRQQPAIIPTHTDPHATHATSNTSAPPPTLTAQHIHTHTYTQPPTTTPTLLFYATLCCAPSPVSPIEPKHSSPICTSCLPPSSTPLRCALPVCSAYTTTRQQKHT